MESLWEWKLNGFFCLFSVSRENSLFCDKVTPSWALKGSVSMPFCETWAGEDEEQEFMNSIPIKLNWFSSCMCRWSNQQVRKKHDPQASNLKVVLFDVFICRNKSWELRLWVEIEHSIIESTCAEFIIFRLCFGVQLWGVFVTNPQRIHYQLIQQSPVTVP